MDDDEWMLIIILLVGLKSGLVVANQWVATTFDGVKRLKYSSSQNRHGRKPGRQRTKINFYANSP
jgi:hypothetical protein